MGNDDGREDYPFLKSAYYTGKLLHAADFIREQKYGNSKLEFVNRKFHGWGIIEGLEVRTGQDGSLYLSKGSAIDPQGRILTVPEDRHVTPEEIEGIRAESEQDLILGVCYAEQVLEMERDYSKKEDCCQPSVIAETYALKAFDMAELEKLKREAFRYEDILTEERVLYENGVVVLKARIPKIVPADSLFRICIRVQTVPGSNVYVGWRGMAKLQGAVFAQSGEASLVLEEEPAVCAGSFQREWEICTEENRTLPVMLEISDLEIITESTEITGIQACQFPIGTAVSYDQAVRKYLQDHVEQNRSGTWVPLARLRMEEAVGQNSERSRYVFSAVREQDVRFHVIRPYEEEILKRIAEENGILDIRWRGLLKHIWYPPAPPGPVLPGPTPPGPMPPIPPEPIPPFPPEDLLTERRFRELLDADRGSRIGRGIIVIQVPKHYRRGKVLLSEEISHGFPGEEVFLKCGRVREEHSYIYWEHDKKRYRIIQGEEGLFRDVCDGWGVEKLAVMQNVEAGTFQIALTLRKGRRKNRSREVAVSWTAVKSV